MINILNYIDINSLITFVLLILCSIIGILVVFIYVFNKGDNERKQLIEQNKVLICQKNELIIKCDTLNTTCNNLQDKLIRTEETLKCTQEKLDINSKNCKELNDTLTNQS